MKLHHQVTLIFFIDISIHIVTSKPRKKNWTFQAIDPKTTGYRLKCPLFHVKGSVHFSGVMSEKKIGVTIETVPI